MARVLDEEVVARVLDGESSRSIATGNGWDQAEVWRRVKRATGMGPTELRVARGVRVDPSIRNAEIVAQFAAGEQIEDLATQHGLSPHSIKKALRQSTGMGLPDLRAAHGLPGPRGWFANVSGEEVVARVRSGESIRDLAEHYGCTSQAVESRILRQTGMTVRQLLRSLEPQTARSTELVADVVAAAQSGSDIGTVAAHHGVTTREAYSAVLQRTGQDPRQLRLPPNGTGTSPNTERNAAIVDRIRGGERAGDVATEYGISASRVSQLVRRATGMGIRDLQLPSAEMLHQIAATYEAGTCLTIPAVARQFQVSTEVVKSALKMASLPIERPESTRALGPQMAELYEGGMTTIEIGDWFGVNEVTVRRNLDAQQVPRRTIQESRAVGLERRALDGPSRVDAMAAEMVELYEGGMSVHAIADWCCVSTVTVCRNLDSQQVPRRTIVESKAIGRERQSLEGPS